MSLPRPEHCSGPVSNNWSSLLNWTNVTGSGYGPPGPANDVVFTNTGAVALSNQVDNVVDLDTTINSLVFANTGGFHTTLIAPGRTLTVLGTAPGYQNAPALDVGLDTNPPTAATVGAAITGPDGTLVISNSSACVQVRQGFASGTVGTLATLDMSGLGTFVAASADSNSAWSPARRGAWRGRYLARTNTILLWRNRWT